MAGKASFFSWLLTPVGLAAALTSLVVLVVVLAVLFLISELMKPTPKNGTPATLPNGMKIMQWQSSETTFLYEEIFGSESAYSQRGEGKIDFKPGSVIFDCGANIGMFSLYAAMRCKGDATIYSFEPIGSTYNVMAANAAAANRGEYSKWFGGNNLRIVPLNKGCSDVKAEVEFEHHPNFSVWSTQDATFAQARLDRIAADLPRATANSPNFLVRAIPSWFVSWIGRKFLSRAGETVKVPASLVPLSDIIEKEGVKKIDVLKVDVEGAELMVLKGIKDAHWPMIQQVVLEVESFEMRDKITALLKSKGIKNTAWIASERERSPGVLSEVCMVYARRDGVATADDDDQGAAPVSSKGASKRSSAKKAEHEEAEEEAPAPTSTASRRGRRKEA